MDEVETAAADTTSEHSYTPAHHHQAHAHQPSHMTAPTYSTATHESFPHQRTSSWEEHTTPVGGIDEMYPDESFAETSSPPMKRSRMAVDMFGSQALQMSPKTSVHVRQRHGGRPVGIAQPIQLQDTLQAETEVDTPDTDLQKMKSLHEGVGGPIHSDNAPPRSTAQVQFTSAAALRSKQSTDTSKSSDHHTTSFSQDLVTHRDDRGSTKYFEEAYDSDQSQETQRFNKFINESRRDGGVAIGNHPLRGTTLSSSQESPSSDDTSSESTGHFMASYTTTMGKDSDRDGVACSSTVLGQGSPVGAEHRGGVGLSSEPIHEVEQDRRVRERQRYPKTHAPSSQSLEGFLPLPDNKKWHLFVSHSTSSQDWARDDVIARLTSAPHRMRVAACYQSMPDRSRYDDKEIQSRMRESCVIMIALSPLYLQSGRCNREWNLAVDLHHEGRVPKLVVAAVAGPCSRPDPLRLFLHLDFMDRSKREVVWGKLLEAINSAVQKILPPSMPPVSSHHQHPPMFEDQPPSHVDDDIFSRQIPLVGADTDFDKQRYPVPEDSAHFQGYGHAQQSDTGTQSTSEVETEDSFYDSSMYHKQLQAGFEAMYEELGHDTSQSEGEKERSSVCQGDSDVIADPRGSSGESVSQVTQKERVSRVVRGEGEEKIDVEEGEVSDSSDETGGKKKEELKGESEVAKFYNKLAQPDADRRDESPIFYMRNFNNWVKSILIRSHLSQLPTGATVLDLCCGKGGDMLKWKEGRIEYLVCADISEDSVKTCETGRYYSDRMINRSTGRPPFDAEFIVADCCEVRLRDRYRNPARRFNLTSCQFSVHYSFESYRRAHMMLRNACENLRPNGYFIGTTVDSNEVVHRLRKAGQNEEGLWSIGNDIFTVTLDPSLDIYHLPLFGARYNFKLHGVVDLPEYLVHFPLLVDMLKDFDMELVLRQNFYDFFAERRHNTDDVQLLHRMKAFNMRKGSMSPSEWEAIGLYLVYVFRKRDRERR